MAKINRHSLFFINAVKYRRLVKGLTTRELSEKIKKSEGYVGVCEGGSTSQKYNSADYPLIANELECELTDLLPPKDWQFSDSHAKVDKVVVSLSDPEFVLRVLEGIKVSPNAGALEEINTLYRHLSTKDATEKAIIKKVWEEFRK